MPVTLRSAGRREARSRARPGVRYKWVALSNTTLGALLASINASIMLIARAPRPTLPRPHLAADHRVIHPDRSMTAHPVGAETCSRVLQSGGDHDQDGHSRNIR